jgi:cytochrome c-type biogenesis protein
MMSENLLLFAFVSGIFATFNPCGFAMLPAYLAMAILGSEGTRSKRAIAKGALNFSILMGSGVLAVFTLFAVVIFPFSTAIQKYLPFVTLVLGFAILLLSVSMLTGKFSVSMRRWGPNISPNHRPSTYFGYGITFALGSISCTIGPFLAVTSTAIASSHFFKIALTFLAFGAGISVTISILALVTATSNQIMIKRIRNSTRKIELISAILLFLVGIYLVYFGWYEISLQATTPLSNPFMDSVFRLQGVIVSWVTKALEFLNLL